MSRSAYARACMAMKRFEKSASSKTLVSLIQGLQGVCATIDLRNEISVRGTIHHVDHHMNTTVTGATYTKLSGECQCFDQLFVPGVQIRYVQIPEEIDIIETISRQVSDLLLPSQGVDLYKRQKMRRSKLKRHEQERRWAREHKLGKGRAQSVGMNPTKGANFTPLGSRPGPSTCSEAPSDTPIPHEAERETK